ncbi:cell wall metabolism sensor histidine kinase WalK [Paenibacillus sp. OV219]|uniref:sensor histidine kinase n=1 Tax=Paenibacillus sp. OV219 TaxID=1884377 RepID=UPI0008B2B369|nr:ATP-binding protein [Paenibacillus sp. OV219]SEP15789.1 His Kinase A (phospho-acceptor) domain-containing protein [Paenibacillus sp. OV219]
MKGLNARIAIACIGIASGVLLISMITFIFQAHYHLTMVQKQTDNIVLPKTFNEHFEQALIQSVLMIAILGVILAIIISLLVAKRITAPLVQMKKAAERMAKGELTSRTYVEGKDEIADLGNSLNHLAEQLQLQEQLRKTLTADVAHELRTPLTTLKSHMEAMIEGVWEPTPKRLESCFDEIERLRFLIGDLEQLTEVESPNFKLQLREENIVAIIQHHIDASQAAFERNGVQLAIEACPIIEAVIDKYRFGQIMSNLLNNALKFTPQNGTVTVQIKEVNSMVSIMITDTGIGIEEKDLSLVFERFYRVDKSRDRKSGGGGLGLTIVKKLVEAHNGEIQMDSRIGEGTTVSIFFPKPHKIYTSVY